MGQCIRCGRRLRIPAHSARQRCAAAGHARWAGRCIDITHGIRSWLCPRSAVVGASQDGKELPV
ncbi:CRISPR-associated DxTHG motif protein [Pseudomonas leptonychotis]|uniref:CRISPR-associated DxTHG motif protein n=1 Tax=Pseudomonas leptonychotis TaxID=2448482 RepID=A0A4T2A6D4_9PSED|nr:CRISPR-associated DxTHG motif protein [Pseudomonas leptonychotis]